MVVLILVSGSIFASLVFSYLFLWTVSPDVWPKDLSVLPGLGWPLAALVLLAASAACVGWCSRRLRQQPKWAPWKLQLGMVLATGLLCAAFGADLAGQWLGGLSPRASAYGAAVYMVLALQGFFVLVMVFMGLYTAARSWAGLLDGVRRVTFDNTRVFWYYVVIQGAIGLVLVHGFPRLVK